MTRLKARGKDEGHIILLNRWVGFQLRDLIRDSWNLGIR